MTSKTSNNRHGILSTRIPTELPNNITCNYCGKANLQGISNLHRHLQRKPDCYHFYMEQKLSNVAAPASTVAHDMFSVSNHDNVVAPDDQLLSNRKNDSNYNSIRTISVKVIDSVFTCEEDKENNRPTMVEKSVNKSEIQNVINNNITFTEDMVNSTDLYCDDSDAVLELEFNGHDSEPEDDDSELEDDSQVEYVMDSTMAPPALLTTNYKKPRNDAYLSSVSEIAFLELICLLDSWNAPRYAFNEILRWCRKHALEGYDFRSPHPSRKSFIKQLSKGMNVPIPTTHSVLLSGVSVLVHTFDAKEQLMHLLSNQKLFGDLSNLAIDPTNRWGRPSTGGSVDELTSAQWFQQTYESVITDPGNELLFPIIIYVDKTAIDKHSHYGLEPVMMTSGLFNRTTRSLPESWVHLGFIPDIGQVTMTSDDLTEVIKLGSNCRKYHLVLSKVLESLVEVQRNSPILCPVQLGDEKRIIKVHFEVACIMGDGKSADTLVGRYGSYCEGTGRICRTCDCSFDNADNEKVICSPIDYNGMIKQHVICASDPQLDRKSRLISRKYLQRVSQHIVRPALDLVRFGYFQHNWINAVPVDIMHCYLEGVLEHVLVAIFSGLSANHCDAFNRVAFRLFKESTARQQEASHDEYPRTAICKGLCQTTMVTAKEWLGKTFCFLLVLITGKGDSILREHLLSDRSGSGIVDAPNRTVKEVREAIEFLLLFYYRCVDGPYWGIDSNNEIKVGETEFRTVVCYLIAMIKAMFTRNSGNEWKLQKMHDLMHLGKQITLFGSLRNVDAGICEKNLKEHAKKPGRSSQKHGQVAFLNQVSSRVTEQHVLREARQQRLSVPLLKTFNDNDEWTSTDIQSMESATPATPVYKFPFAYIGIDAKYTKPYSIGYRHTPENNNNCPELHENTIKAISDHFIRNVGNGWWKGELSLYSEIDVNGVKLRAHSNYQGRGPWYDWVSIEWEEQRNQNLESIGNLYPAKLLCFLADDRHPSFIYACVHSCTKPGGGARVNNTRITFNWELEYRTSAKIPVVRIVSANSIRQRILCLQHGSTGPLGGDPITGSVRVTEVIPKAEWGKKCCLSRRDRDRFKERLAVKKLLVKMPKSK